MSHFTCPHCQHTTHIFSSGTSEPGNASSPLELACKEKGIELLGDIPLFAGICRDADRGVPTVVAEPNGVYAKAFRDVAEKVERKLWGDKKEVEEG